MLVRVRTPAVVSAASTAGSASAPTLQLTVSPVTWRSWTPAMPDRWAVADDPHLTWQATKSYVERGDAFGLILHQGSLTARSGSFVRLRSQRPYRKAE